MRISALGGVSHAPDPVTTLSQTGERLAACLEDARGALSGHTVRALRADLGVFASWCAERELSPLPALAGTVAAYVDAMADAPGPGHRAPLRLQHRHGAQGGRGAKPARAPRGAAGAAAGAPAERMPAEAGYGA